MRVRGWNGDEDESNVQWTFAGSLFYSIVCITTIGYGDQTPKTQIGKIVTILYSLIGMPLMFVCFSNTGAAMADCFRYIYWKCYHCCCGIPKPPPNNYYMSRASHTAPLTPRSLVSSSVHTTHQPSLRAFAMGNKYSSPLNRYFPLKNVPIRTKRLKPYSFFYKDKCFKHEWSRNTKITIEEKPSCG